MAAGGGEFDKAADEALKAGLGGWWGRADDNQKLAVVGLTVAAALGPLGQGLLGAAGVLFSEAALPSSKQLAAVFWLFVITLPVAAWLMAVILLAGHAPPAVVFIVAGFASYFGGVLMARAGVPTHIGNLYCFATLHSNGVHYESACRTFNENGFASHTYSSLGNASKSTDIFGWAVAYTADARGEIMVFASAIAAVSLGYLIRRSA